MPIKNRNRLKNTNKRKSFFIFCFSGKKKKNLIIVSCEITADERTNERLFWTHSFGPRRRRKRGRWTWFNSTWRPQKTEGSLRELFIPIKKFNVEFWTFVRKFFFLFHVSIWRQNLQSCHIFVKTNLLLQHFPAFLCIKSFDGNPLIWKMLCNAVLCRSELQNSDCELNLLASLV